jgi:hypothetical protein
MNNFRTEKPFEAKPPRLKDLVNEYIMGDVWIRDTPFGPVTDSLKIAEHFDMKHKHILRAIDNCTKELSIEPKFGLNENFIENKYLGGAKGKERKILYRFFILKSYVEGLSENQIGALKGYYRNKMKD